MLRLLLLWTWTWAFIILQTLANTEKTIFIAPPSIPIPDLSPGLDTLCLRTLSPVHHTMRTKLAVSFPTIEQPRGNQSWFLLDRLDPARRYEVRVCWLATVGNTLSSQYTVKRVKRTLRVAKMVRL